MLKGSGRKDLFWWQKRRLGQNVLADLCIFANKMAKKKVCAVLFFVVCFFYSEQKKSKSKKCNIPLCPSHSVLQFCKKLFIYFLFAFVYKQSEFKSKQND